MLESTDSGRTNCTTSIYLTRVLEIPPIALEEFYTPFFNDLTQQAIRVIPGPDPHLDLVGQCIIDYQYRQNDRIAQANVIDRGDINTNKRTIPHVNTQPAH